MSKKNQCAYPGCKLKKQPGKEHCGKHDPERLARKYGEEAQKWDVKRDD